MNEMSPTKLTNAPEGFKYYKVYDHQASAMWSEECRKYSDFFIRSLI